MGIIVGVKIKAIFGGTKYVLLAHVVGAPLSCDWGIQLLNFRPQKPFNENLCLVISFSFAHYLFNGILGIRVHDRFLQFALVKITYYFLIAKVF